MPTSQQKLNLKQAIVSIQRAQAEFQRQQALLTDIRLLMKLVEQFEILDESLSALLQLQNAADDESFQALTKTLKAQVTELNGAAQTIKSLVAGVNALISVQGAIAGAASVLPTLFL